MGSHNQKGHMHLASVKNLVAQGIGIHEPNLAFYYQKYFKPLGSNISTVGRPNVPRLASSVVGAKRERAETPGFRTSGSF